MRLVRSRKNADRSALLAAVVLLVGAAPTQPPDDGAFQRAAALHGEGTAQALRQAIDAYLSALQERRTAGDSTGEIRTLLALGQARYDLGDLDSAVEHFSSALERSRGGADRRSEAAALVGLGSVQAMRGERQKALEGFGRARDLCGESRDASCEGKALTHLGLLFRSLGEHERALEHFLEALPLRRAAADRRGEAHTLNNIGLSHVDLHRPAKALDFFERALVLRDVVGDRQGRVSTLINMAAAYRELADDRRERETLDQALALAHSIGDLSGQAAGLNNLAATLFRLGDTDGALARYAEALRLGRSIGNRQTEIVALANMARVERDRGNLAAARTHLEAAIDGVEADRTKIVVDSLRASYFAMARRYYERYIDLRMQLHRERPTEGHAVAAFEWSERARARVQIEMLAAAGVDFRDGIDANLLGRERAVRRRLESAATRQARILAGDGNPSQAAEAARDVEAWVADFALIEAEMRARSPRYAELVWAPPLTLQDIQRDMLDGDTLLLEYALGDRRSFLWVVAADTMSSFELPGRTEIEEKARRFRNLLRAQGDGIAAGPARHKRPGEMNDAGIALSQVLLAPAADLLGRKRLVFVTEGALQLVPFAALPPPRSARSAARSRNERVDPLLVDHEVVTLPSASTLAALRRRPRPAAKANKLVAVVADPVFSADDVRVARSAVRSAATGTRPLFDRLPFSRREGAAILAVTLRRAGEGLFGFQANKNAVVGGALAPFRFVHFATHAVVDDTRPERSAVVLSLVDDRGRARDGLLRLDDVYRLRLSADLVVLSACGTALGKDVRGEGLIGLARGFLHAGARSVVASLWKVDDAATAALMQRFYRELIGPKAKRPAAALRTAQLSLRQDPRWRGSWHWVAFVFQGDWH